MAKCFRKTLIDTRTNHYVEAWQLASDNLASYEGPPWRITKFVLKGGKQHGVDVVELDNGKMAITILPTRGMNVLEVRTDDLVLGWNSPVREVVHPAYVQAESRGGLGWLEGFNELMCRCGLESTGAPCEDVLVDNQGNESIITLPLHGHISNCPASKLWVSVEVDEPHRLTVAGEVPEARMFGPSFLLLTSVSTIPGSSEFTIRDEIRNARAVAQEMEVLYHCNFGPPLLGSGARLVAPVETVYARDEVALAGMGQWQSYGPPQPGFTEQCYYFRLHGDQAGKTLVALVDPEEALAAAIRFSTAQLPAFTLWKNTSDERDGYVTGLEPGTDYPNSRKFERECGRVITMEPGESYETELTFGLRRGEQQVKDLQKEVKALAEGKAMEVCERLDPQFSPG